MYLHILESLLLLQSLLLFAGEFGSLVIVKKISASPSTLARCMDNNHNPQQTVHGENLVSKELLA